MLGEDLVAEDGEGEVEVGLGVELLEGAERDRQAGVGARGGAGRVGAAGPPVLVLNAFKNYGFKHRGCGMVRRVFTWTMAVLLAAQPVAVVVWCLGRMERTDPLFLAPLWGSGAVAVLFLASRLVVRRTMARWRAEMRWLGRAAGRYLLCCLTPVLLLYVVAALRAPGGEDEYGYPLPKPEHYLNQLGFLVVWMTVPTLVLLLVQSPRAQRGRHVGGLVAVLPSMTPSLFALLGYWPALVPVVLQTVYALAVTPSIVTVCGRAGGDRNTG
ncbi:hypothetical protein [Kitasatospora sp. NPDC056184]|uniref:hypothetical protein n=1 Tax=Kitasatospora sp. NPDC056184 TaxID=3345738 RepID=UPI0035D91553